MHRGKRSKIHYVLRFVRLDDDFAIWMHAPVSGSLNGPSVYQDNAVVPSFPEVDSRKSRYGY